MHTSTQARLSIYTACVSTSRPHQPGWNVCVSLMLPTHCSGSSPPGTDTNQSHLITRPKCSSSQFTVHNRDQGTLPLIIHCTATSDNFVANSNNCHGPVTSQKCDRAPQDFAHHSTRGPNSPANSIAWCHNPSQPTRRWVPSRITVSRHNHSHERSCQKRTLELQPAKHEALTHVYYQQVWSRVSPQEAAQSR